MIIVIARSVSDVAISIIGLNALWRLQRPDKIGARNDR